MQPLFFRSLFFLALAALLWQCDSPPQSESISTDSFRKAEERNFVSPPAFNADSAYAFVEQQVAFGPRVPNTPEHVACGNFLIEKLRGWGAKMTIQEFRATAFDGTALNGKNIMASINPGAQKRVLLAAHWDTRPFADQDDERQSEPILGANDGGSGVAVLLEVARTILTAADKPNIGVDIMLFDLEDYGKSNVRNSYCLGSQYWSANKVPAGYSAYYGILLDMVGAKDAQFYREAISMEYAPRIVERVWNMGQQMGYATHFIQQNTDGVTDDHYYVNEIAKIPMIDIIQHDPQTDNFFGAYWHTHDDNMDIISRQTLKAVGHTVLAVIYNE